MCGTQHDMQNTPEILASVTNRRDPVYTSASRRQDKQVLARAKLVHTSKTPIVHTHSMSYMHLQGMYDICWPRHVHVLNGLASKSHLRYVICCVPRHLACAPRHVPVIPSVCGTIACIHMSCECMCARECDKCVTQHTYIHTYIHVCECDKCVATCVVRVHVCLMCTECV